MLAKSWAPSYPGSSARLSASSSERLDRFSPFWVSTLGCSYLLLWPSSWKGFSRRGVDNKAYTSKYTNCYKCFVYVMRVNRLCCCLCLCWCTCGLCCWFICGVCFCLFWCNPLGLCCLFVDGVCGMAVWWFDLAWTASH